MDKQKVIFFSDTLKCTPYDEVKFEAKREEIKQVINQVDSLPSPDCFYSQIIQILNPESSKEKWFNLQTMEASVQISVSRKKITLENKFPTHFSFDEFVNW